VTRALVAFAPAVSRLAELAATNGPTHAIAALVRRFLRSIVASVAARASS